MTYKVIASPIRGQRIIKSIEGVRSLHDYLAECHELGIEVTRVRRTKRPVVQSTKELQVM